MTYAGIIIGLLLVFIGIWLFGISLYLNGLDAGFLTAVRSASPWVVIGFVIFAISYFLARKK